MLSLMDTEVSLIVKVLRKRISLMCFRARLEVQVRKNPTALVVGVSERVRHAVFLKNSPHLDKIPLYAIHIHMETQNSF